MCGLIVLILVISVNIWWFVTSVPVLCSGILQPPQGESAECPDWTGLTESRSQKAAACSATHTLSSWAAGMESLCTEHSSQIPCVSPRIPPGAAPCQPRKLGILEQQQPHRGAVGSLARKPSWLCPDSSSAVVLSTVYFQGVPWWITVGRKQLKKEKFKVGRKKQRLWSM